MSDIAFNEIHNEVKKLNGTWFKRSKIPHAFWYINGQWSASTRLNTDVFKPNVGVQRVGSRKKMWGVTDAMTYCEAVDMRRRIDAGQTTVSREARLDHTDIKVYHRVMDYLETKGAAGFMRFDHKIKAGNV
jgi:hypothetical protein